MTITMDYGYWCILVFALFDTRMVHLGFGFDFLDTLRYCLVTRYVYSSNDNDVIVGMLSTNFRSIETLRLVENYPVQSGKLWAYATVAELQEMGDSQQIREALVASHLSRGFKSL